MFKGLFGKGGDGRPKKVVKFEKKITNMYLQKADRRYFLDQLRQLGTEQAAEALLKRFGCSCDNTTVDRDEKELTHQLLISMGDMALGPVDRYLRTIDKHVNWAFRTMHGLVGDVRYQAFLIELLNDIGPEYVRDPERKEQLMLIAGDYKNEEMCRALLPYLDDHDETIRLNAADAAIKQGFDFIVEPLAVRFAEEESTRILRYIADAFVEHLWVIPNGEEIRENIPEGYKLKRSNVLVKANKK